MPKEQQMNLMTMSKIMIILNRLVFWSQVKGQRRGENDIDKFLRWVSGGINIRNFFQIKFRHLYRGALGHSDFQCERIFQKYPFSSGRFKF